MCQPALTYMPACVSVCQHTHTPRHPPFSVILYPGLVPVTAVSYHIAFLSGIPWLLSIMHDVHDVPQAEQLEAGWPLVPSHEVVWP